MREFQETKMKIKLNSNAIITNKEGKILLVKLKGGPFKGGLCIPGGGVEFGELSLEAAKREILEETGISVESDFIPVGFCELMHNGMKQHKVVMIMHSTAEGTPKETEEGVGKWMTYEEAEPNLLAFAKEAIRIWKSGEKYFKLVNDEVDVKDNKFSYD
jgi:ADP-ribose pyrophosphatase YjhB (NUDIX family)